MTPARLTAGAVGLALVSLYGVMAVNGVRGGWALEKADAHVWYAEYDEALPLLETAAARLGTFTSVRTLAETYIDTWEEQAYLGGPPAADHRLLERAAQRLLEALCAAPASKSVREGLGDVYEAIEWVEREARAESGVLPVDDAWARVGRPGRVALGLMRQARDRAPNRYALHDRLALMFWSFGLEDEARKEVIASARVLPLFWPHAYRWVPDLPDWIVDTFADSSWEMLQDSELHATDHLIDLGKLERRRGRPEQAVRALREALDGRASAVDRAEASFHLGLALQSTGEYEEGSDYLMAATEHPSLRVPALENLARSAERAGHVDQALEHLRALRWHDPSSVEYCLEFSRVARRLKSWDEAKEALNWAQLNHPDDRRPRVGLIETHIDMNDLPSARGGLRDLQRWQGDATDVARLQRAIDIASRLQP